MKKKISSFLLSCSMLALLSAIPVVPKNSKSFEGVITYKISFDQSSMPPQQAAMLEGSKVVLYTKKGMSRMVMDIVIQKITKISNTKTKQLITLFDNMGNKYMIIDTLKNKEGKLPKISYTSQTKKIAGYNCRKAILTAKGKDGQTHNVTVYYTEQLPEETQGEFKGLKGCPLEYTMNRGGMSFTITAQSVEKKSLSDTLFVAPKSGYTLTTRQQLMQQAKGSGGQ